MTMIEPFNAIPAALRAMVDHNWISGKGFPPDTSVTVRISGGFNGHVTTQNDSRGDFFAEGWKYWPGMQLSPGDRIEADVATEHYVMTI